MPAATAPRVAPESGGRRSRAVQRPRTRGKLRVHWRRTILAAVILYVGVTLCGQEITMFRINREIDRLSTQIAVERERAVILDAEIAYRDSDEYIELVARRELGMVRPGEVPVINGVRP